MTTYYAWSNFEGLPGKDGRPSNKISPGDVVTAADLGVNDEQFEEYVESGSIRTVKYPEMGNFSGSPRELRIAQLHAAAKGEDFDLATYGLPDGEPPEGEAATPPATGETPPPVK